MLILVADDTDMNRKYLSAVCDSQGHRTREACNGQEVMDAVGRERFDLILMDVMMPVMDGIEATRRIRALGNDAANAPIIGVTALDRDTVEDRARQAGMNAMLFKPFRIGQLLDVLTRCAVA